MGAYGSGMTSGRLCMMEKEMIRHALNGEMRVGESLEGFVYDKCDNKEELDSVILKAYDEAYFQLKRALDSGRAQDAVMRDIIKDYNLEISERDILDRYTKHIMEEERRFLDDYKYEDEEED